MNTARQAEEIILLRSRCAALMPDVEKILQHNLDGVHPHATESVSVWDVPEFSHVDDWAPDWLAASGLDEAASLADTRRRAELAMDDRYRERRVYYIDMVSEDLPDRALYGCRLPSLFQ